MGEAVDLLFFGVGVGVAFDPPGLLLGVAFGLPGEAFAPPLGLALGSVVGVGVTEISL